MISSTLLQVNHLIVNHLIASSSHAPRGAGQGAAHGDRVDHMQIHITGIGVLNELEA